MTTRQILNLILSPNMSEEAKEWAIALFEDLDIFNTQCSSKSSKCLNEDRPIRDVVLEYISHSHYLLSASDIAKACGITVRTVSGICLKLEREGLLTSEWITFPRKGKTKFYSLA